MKLEFDLANVQVTEFGVGLEGDNGQSFVVVPVDAGVQQALHEMAESTWNAMQSDDGGPAKYEPSEKHAATEYLYLPLDDGMAESIRNLQQTANLDRLSNFFSVNRGGAIHPEWAFKASW